MELSEEKKSNCSVCGDPIPIARMQIQPRVVTCSHRCSRVHSARINRETSKRAWDRAQRDKGSGGIY